MLSKIFNNNYFNLNKGILFIFSLYLTLLISFFFGENSTGGAISDYNNQKFISSSFSINFKETLFNYDNFSTRHSPILIIFLSIFEKLNLSDLVIRIIHLHLCLLLPYFFYQILKLKFESIDKKILLLLVGLIFLSPTFRSLAIWPDSRILGLTFFSLSIIYYLKFKQKLNFNFALLNIFTCAISSYISPNFSLFSLFFLYNYLKIFNVLSKKMLIIYSLNLVLALPAIYYIFVLDINFLNKTAAINFNEGEKIFFNNIFNDILITFTIIFFYFLPFLIEKIIKFEKVYRLDYLIFSLILFSVCVYFFNYNYSYSEEVYFLKFHILYLIIIFLLYYWINFNSNFLALFIYKQRKLYNFSFNFV